MQWPLGANGWQPGSTVMGSTVSPESSGCAVSVVVEHGGGGSSVAAPIARDIILAAQNGGLPPVEAYPQAQRNRIESMIRSISEQIGPPATPDDARSRA